MLLPTSLRRWNRSWTFRLKIWWTAVTVTMRETCKMEEQIANAVRTQSVKLEMCERAGRNERQIGMVFRLYVYKIFISHQGGH